MIGKFLAPAAVLAVWLAISPLSVALAGDFTESCVAGGGGLLEEKDCACMNDKATGGDRTDLIAFFDANTAEQKGGPAPDASNPRMQKGMELLNKFMSECLK